MVGAAGSFDSTAFTQLIVLTRKPVAKATHCRSCLDFEGPAPRSLSLRSFEPVEVSKGQGGGTKCEGSGALGVRFDKLNVLREEDRKVMDHRVCRFPI